jgi:hypothetical protein
MNDAVSIIRADPWVFFGVLVALSWLAGALTKGAGFFKSLLAQLLAAAAALGITAAVGSYSGRIGADVMRQLGKASLTGSFSASGGKLGTWTVSPSRCLDGKERGFEGLLFVFEDGPVKELRIDTARKSQSTVSVLLGDERASLIKLRERDCQRVSVKRLASNRRQPPKARAVQTGSVLIACAELKGQAAFESCE